MRDRTDGPGDPRMTLAFDLTAITRLTDPAAVFKDAQEWSRYVGVVGDDPETVTAFVAKHELQQDFDVEHGDKLLALQAVHQETGTSRYVYVGTEPREKPIVEHAGFEFIHLHEAARKAGWTVEKSTRPTGVISRLRSMLGV